MRTALFILLLLFQPWLFAQSANDTATTKAWREFTRKLETAGVEILNTYPQPEALDRAEGLRYLLQQLGSSIQQKLIDQPAQISLLRVGATTINKWGMDGADAKYQGAAISGTGSYRFYGQLGSARLFATQLTRIGGTFAAYDTLTGDQLRADKTGNFEVLIAAHKPEDWRGVWLKLNPEADNLLIREYFSDWAEERPGHYYLERLDNAAITAPVTTEQMATLLSDTARVFSSRAPQWQARVEQARQHLVNKVHMKKADGQGMDSNAYGSSWFSVDHKEALIIELEAPDALLWSVQLGNVWWESIDYINHTASYNDSQAIVGNDGKYRFVLSHEDPGVVNWLDPAGHTEGALLFRLQKTAKIVNPVMKKVLFSELAEHLPKGTSRVSIEQRQREIAARRRHAAVRWAP
ncbi:MAG: hypothetical protein ACR2P1_11420 [Pseudomonadales bacterium]